MFPKPFRTTLAAFFLFTASTAFAVDYPGVAPGTATISNAGDQITLGNQAISLTWNVTNTGLQLGNITDANDDHFGQHGTEPFRIKTKAGANYDLPASQFSLQGKLAVSDLPANPHGLRVAERFAGKAVSGIFKDSATGMVVEWQAILRDNSNYIRQIFTLRATDKSIELKGLQLLDIDAANAKQVGTAQGGNPVVAGHLFAGVENPLAENQLANSEVRIGFDCNLVLDAAHSYTFSNVIGTYPDDQLRRAFLVYVERERARPSTPFLEYNCWFDFAQGVTAKNFLASIQAYHDELTMKRGVPIQSFVIDDGWDDHVNTFWGVDKKKFPGGFAPVAAALTAIGSHLGIWISPLGGYGEREMRTDNAIKEHAASRKPLDLSDPVYYKWFRDKCLSLMKDDGVNYFKWDKAGEGVSPHFMALLHVADELHAANPQLFINVTVGTWPSPFWLNSIDSTWRTGTGDMGWMGKGDKREQWITFRDWGCYSHVVKTGPLYPINSIMHHGIVLGYYYQGGEVAKAGAHLKNEARSYFAAGSTLQELYLSPKLMTPQAWDEVADAAKWAHKNAAVLVDAHWVGGDPQKLESYGYAAWSPSHATLMVRNPSDQPQEIKLDAQTVWQLPKGAAQQYQLVSPYPDQRVKTLTLTAGQSQAIQLQPFEVLVFDAAPALR